MGMYSENSAFIENWRYRPTDQETIAFEKIVYYSQFARGENTLYHGDHTENPLGWS